jgi:hypothetical protein
LSPGAWRGENLAGDSAAFGQILQPASRQSVEFTNIVVAAVTLIMPKPAFRWQGS